MNAKSKFSAQEILQFRSSLKAESDRGCALLAASYLDEQLRLLLQASLVKDSTVFRVVSSHTGSLGSFSSRIDFTYMLGLVSKEARNDLHLIRKIRNDFGHSPMQIKFSDIEIASRCRGMHHIFVEAEPDARKIFITSVLSLLGEIHGGQMSAKHLVAPKGMVVDDKLRKFVAEIRDAELKSLNAANESGGAAAVKAWQSQQIEVMDVFLDSVREIYARKAEHGLDIPETDETIKTSGKRSQNVEVKKTSKRVARSNQQK